MRKEIELNNSDQKIIDETINHWVKSLAFIEPEVLSFEKKFLTIAFLMEEDEQEKFARLYCQYIAGVIVPQEWWQEQNRGWLSQVGMNLNSGGDSPPLNGVGFYQEMQKAIPGIFTEKELSWLIENDPTGGGALRLLFGISRSPKSPLPIMIERSIHSWK